MTIYQTLSCFIKYKIDSNEHQNELHTDRETAKCVGLSGFILKWVQLAACLNPASVGSCRKRLRAASVVRFGPCGVTKLIFHSVLFYGPRSSRHKEVFQFGTQCDEMRCLELELDRPAGVSVDWQVWNVQSDGMWRRGDGYTVTDVAGDMGMGGRIILRWMLCKKMGRRGLD